LLEKNSNPGQKLLIAGSGRCNITHSGAITNFFLHYGKHGKFLKNALKEFSNVNFIDFFKNHGLITVTDKNGKVFPETDRSYDILQSLLQECNHIGVTIKTNSLVVSVSKNDNLFTVVTTNEKFYCVNLVIATGGITYPNTGSTGDGYSFARSFGHSIVTPKPALTPVFVKDYRMANLAGVSLPGVLISLYRSNIKIAEHVGDVGFTHKGLSGPGILDFSRHFEVNDLLRFNFINCNEEAFRRHIIDTTVKQGNMSIQTLLRNFGLPKSLMLVVLEMVDIEPRDVLSNITTKKRNQLIELLCSFPFTIGQLGGSKIAMVTAGGVTLAEVSTKSMMSNLVSNLFFVGEVLDIDGDTGGYNIQAAISTGYIAGKTIRQNG